MKTQSSSRQTVETPAEYLRKQEAIEYCRLSPKVFQALMRKRVFKYIKAGHKTVLFRRSMLDRALQEMETRAIWE